MTTTGHYLKIKEKKKESEHLKKLSSFFTQEDSKPKFCPLMASSKCERQNLSVWRQGTRSNPETLNQTLDLKPDTFWRQQSTGSDPGSLERTEDEPNTTLELPKQDIKLTLGPGMWCYPTNHHYCCIYRVPHILRRVSPEAYTPQLVLIGPLHHYLKSQAPDVTNTKLMGHLNMEEHKKIYLEKFAQRFKDETKISLFREMIKEDEVKIRASYSESTSWIESTEFVEMILLDSVFIVEFILRSTAYYEGSRTETRGDIVVEEPCLHITVCADLILLENQIPYFILNKLFDPIALIISGRTLRSLILGFFGLTGKISHGSKFKHFTDLLRCVRVETLGSEDSEKTTKTDIFRCVRMVTEGSRKSTKTIFKHFTDLFRCGRVKTDGSRESSTKTKFKQFTNLFRCVNVDKSVSSESTKDRLIRHMYNAEKLYSGGVEFVPVNNEWSIDVRFENGCLKIPCLWFRDDMEIMLRNIMALEQCHYPFNTYVCNFVTFLDFLIDDNKDVDLLIQKGIIYNWIGEHSSVAQMVNKLFLGIVEEESYLSDIASKVNAYYENPINRSRVILSRVYFGNLWTGTATIAATLLLLMTLVQTVASVIQVVQNYSKN